MRRQTSDWKKIFTTHISGKVFVFRIHNEFMQFLNEKSNSPT